MAHSFSYQFESTLIEWRGPAPFYFLPIPPEVGAQFKEMANQLTYGWGVIPVTASAFDFDGNEVTWTTSLIPRNGVYLVPVKNGARLPLGLELGQSLAIAVNLQA